MGPLLTFLFPPLPCGLVIQIEVAVIIFFSFFFLFFFLVFFLFITLAVALPSEDVARETTHPRNSRQPSINSCLETPAPKVIAPTHRPSPSSTSAFGPQTARRPPPTRKHAVAFGPSQNNRQHKVFGRPEACDPPHRGCRRKRPDLISEIGTLFHI